MRGTRPLLESLALSLSLLLASACSHRPVAASDSGAPADVLARQTSHLRVRGTFCPGAEPGELRLPTKLLFLVDTSNSMAISDPLDTTTGKTGRHRAIELVIDRFKNNPEVSHAIISFNHVKQVLTKDAAGQGGFTRDPAALKAALKQLDQASGMTDFEGAWSSAYMLLSKEMSRARDRDPWALQHSNYIVFFLADGAPQPQIQSAADWASIPDKIQKEMLGAVPAGSLPQYNVPTRILQRVKEVTQLKTLHGVPSLRVHTFYLQGGPVVSSAAVDLLKSISSAGTFRNFNSPNQIDFLNVNYSSTLSGWPELKTLVVSNQNLRPAASGPAVDSDGDGLTDAEEHKLGSSAKARDSDGDGFSDLLEVVYKGDPLDPKDADCPLASYDLDKDGRRDDSDGDGLLDCEERFLGTHATLPDSDGDGFDDLLELQNRTSPVISDSGDDKDFDGKTNGVELMTHTSPGRDEGAARKGQAYRYTVKQVTSGKDLRSCLSYDVSNILLAGPPLGANTVVLRASQTLGKNPADFGFFRAACVRARPGPAPLSVVIPQSAWKRLGALDTAVDCVSP
jgi:von Willebrand factor type A domain/Bacterial TSP3 repeat